MGKSTGMLVFPRVTKRGAGVAAEYGEGALLVHGKTVGYYSVGAASVGLTLGLARHFAEKGLIGDVSLEGEKISKIKTGK